MSPLAFSFTKIIRDSHVQLIESLCIPKVEKLVILQVYIKIFSVFI